MDRSAIIILLLVAAIGAGFASYQIFYPAQSKPVRESPTWYAIPANKAVIRIVEGASLSTNPEFMVPENATVILGINNTVVFVSEDTVPHGIISDNYYADPVSGLFATAARPEEDGGAFIMPGKTYEFTFTQAGTYPYHHEPHPHIHGRITVLDR